jgi:FkbM family methyltransferase
VRTAGKTADDRRPPPDKIIHFHLPKTGGTSLNRWFDMLVPACRARPPERGEIVVAETARRASAAPQGSRTAAELNVEHHRWHEEFGREARAHWSVIHDHSPAILTTDPSFYRVVILRDPIDRFLSFLRDWRRLTEQDLEQLPPESRDLRRAARTLDADTFVRRFAHHPDITGLQQTWSLVSAAAFALPGSEASSVAGLAQDALVRLFDFVGITEKLDLVAQGLARDLGAPPLEGVGRYNAGHSRGAADTLSTESRRLLEQIFADDMDVYRCARDLFEAQARRLTTEPYDEAAFEERHLDPRLARLAPRFVDGSTVFSLDDQVIGSGFHGREPPGNAPVSVWTGPGTRSVLYVPVPAGERLDMFFDVAEAITPAVRRSLRIRIDGQEPPILRRSIADGVERLALPITTSRSFAKVELLVDRTLTPREAGYDDADSRRLGVNLRGYGYALMPASKTTPTPLGIPFWAFHHSMVAARNRAGTGGRERRLRERHSPAGQAADERVLDALSRELDEIETHARMDGEFERIDPFIIDQQVAGRRFRFIIFNQQSRNWFGHGHPIGQPAPVALGLVRPDDVVFDIGSTAGFSTLWFGLVVGQRGRALAFDPLPWNTAAIRANAQLNGLDNVRSLGIGLSNKASRLRLSHCVQRPIDVPWCADVDSRLDDICDYAHEAPTFIHMRPDGLEHALSRADWHRFPRLERIYLEMHPHYCESLGHDPREVLIRFASHGFAIRQDSSPADPIDPATIPRLESAGWLLERRPRG